MIERKKILGLIPARGGSKGVKDKNLKELLGIPLIGWTVLEGVKSKYLDKLVVSSDDVRILEEAKKWGCNYPSVRPENLASDESPTIDTVLYMLSIMPEYEYIVLLQPTSPLRNYQDIDGCIEFCLEKNAAYCVSVSENKESPFWSYFLSEGDKLQPLMPGGGYTRRQDLPSTYQINGAIYMAKTEKILVDKKFITSETVAYKMPQERAVDIDAEEDFEYIEFLSARKKVKRPIP